MISTNHAEQGKGSWQFLWYEQLPRSNSANFFRFTAIQPLHRMQISDIYTIWIEGDACHSDAGSREIL